MLQKSTLDFLKALKAHNQRAWFHAHRDRYTAARNDVIQLVDQLIGRIAVFDPPVVEMEPADALFRINRDTRFARNKAPYKTNFGAFLTDRGRRVARAGYYLHIEPGECLLAGGLYMPPTPELKAVRRAIVADPRELRRILGRPAFVRAFGKELPGARLRTAPRDIPRNHPDIDLLRLQSFEVYQSFSDRDLLAANFPARAARVFAAMKDFVHWLNRALDARPRPNTAGIVH